VRDVLLWVGGLLLAIAALTFAAFAWQRLDDGGRAALLVFTTVASVAGAFGLRRRLAATAEVFASLGVVLFLVDWLALRRAGAGESMELSSWWAIGAALAAAGSLGLGRWFATTRLLMAVAGSAAAFLALASTAGTAATASGGLSIIGVGAVGASRAARYFRWYGSAASFVVAAILPVTAAGIAVVAGLVDARGGTIGLALAAALVGATPAAGAALRTTSNRARDGLIATSTVAVVAGAAVALSTQVDGPSLAAVVAATTGGVAAVATFGPRAVRRGAFFGSTVALAVAAAFSFEAVMVAVGGPLASLGDAWAHEPSASALSMLDALAEQQRAARAALVSIAVVVAVALLAAAPSSSARLRTSRSRDEQQAPREPHVTGAPLLAAIAAAIAVALVPLTFDANLATASAVTALPAVGAVALVGPVARRRQRGGAAVEGLAISAAALLVPATGWSLATEATTLLLCAGLLTATAAAMWLSPSRTVARQLAGAGAGVSFVALSVSAAMSAGAAWTEAGIVAVVASGVVMAAATLWADERDGDGVLAEVVASAGLFVGMALAVGDRTHGAIACTLLVPAFAVAGTRAGRRGYLVAASLAAVFATWAWLLAADVRLLEAYTLPAALGALVAGQVVAHGHRDASSWLVYAPGLLIAFLPSLALVVADDLLARAVALGAAAVAVAWLGAHFRLQAPLLIGVGSVVGLGLDTLGPIAGDLPRWLTIAIVGAVLVWFGATADRRITQLRATRDRLAAMEPRSDESTPVGS
jgi:hypothetical protein